MSKCPICGSELKEKIVESSLLVKCQKCDYSVVTTHVDPIYEDSSVYTLRLNPKGKIDKKTITEIKKMKGLNTPSAIELLKNGDSEFFVGNAVQIRDVREALDLAGITYTISSNYKW